MTITKEHVAQWALEAGDDWHHTLPSDKEIMHKAMQLAYEAGVKQSNADESDMLTIAHLNGFEKGKEAGKSAVSEPVSHQFQTADGKWCDFLDDDHYQNTVKDGRWPIRALYTTPPAEAKREPATFPFKHNGVKIVRKGHAAGLLKGIASWMRREDVGDYQTLELVAAYVDSLEAAPPAAPAKEPDVVMHCDSNTWTINNPPAKGIDDVSLYYTSAQPAPAQEPLSKEMSKEQYTALAHSIAKRAIEKVHGINIGAKE